MKSQFNGTLSITQWMRSKRRACWCLFTFSQSFCTVTGICSFAFRYEMNSNLFSVFRWMWWINFRSKNASPNCWCGWKVARIDLNIQASKFDFEHSLRTICVVLSFWENVGTLHIMYGKSRKNRLTIKMNARFNSEFFHAFQIHLNLISFILNIFNFRCKTIDATALHRIFYWINAFH